MTVGELEVTLPARSVGALSQNRSGRVEWRPDRSWEAEGQFPRLGLEFLRSPGPRVVASDLPTWFENLLPERGSILRARLCASFGLREGSSYRLLERLGRDLPGAVEVRATAEEQLALELAPEERLRAPAEQTGNYFSSLAGMQLKFSMSMENDRLSLAANSGDRQWIVKLPGRDYPDLAAVETATMTWAKKAGHPVPPHRTVPFEALVGLPNWADNVAPVFAIERFDRRPDGSKIHHEDLCQALALRPSHKNGDARPGVRLEGALRLVHDACGDAEAREMARRIGFMIASGNGDAHLKNWGLVWGDQVRPRLAPCYDLVATISWDIFGWAERGGPKLALKMGTTRRFADLDQAMLREFATRSHHPWAAEEILEGITRARHALIDVDVPIPDRMRRALLEHWTRVPILRDAGPLALPS